MNANKRLALASPEPRTVVSRLGVQLAIHDSDPSATKPVIFCLHATAHGGSDFIAFERAFSADYRIITVDWPGHGASGLDQVPASAQRYAQLFEALVEELAAQHIIILGNSISGAVAIRYAHAHPANVRALLLTDSAGLDKNPGGFLPGLFIAHIERKMRSGADGDARFAKWFADYYADILVTPVARAQRDAIVASGYELAPILSQAWRSFKRADADVRSLARALKMPVFVGWSKRDNIIRWSRNRAAVAQIPNVEVHMFECGHAPFLEVPDAFNSAARSFLSRI